MAKQKLATLLTALASSIKGDWLLVGGALLHYMQITDRPTLDIDLVPIATSTIDDQLRMMSLAEKYGFPPETINFAATHFVRKYKGWEKELVLLYESKHGRLFRPSKKLFRKLKEARGTEIDKLDIQLFEIALKKDLA